MKIWKVDRVSVFLFVASVSFIYDLTLYLGIRDTARFPHPFVYFRSLGDIEVLRGFPGMLRQAMFSFVAGGLIAWPLGFAISRNVLLSEASIRFLRVGIWIPFLVAFVAPDPFILGIAVATLSQVYEYVAARTWQQDSQRVAFERAARFGAVQTFLFTLIAQVWTPRWKWMNPWVISDTIAAACIVAAVALLINWTFREDFGTESGRHFKSHIHELSCSKPVYCLGTTLFIGLFLAFWQIFSARQFSLVIALKSLAFSVFERELWHDIVVSLLQIVGGLVLGGSLALATYALMRKSAHAQELIGKALPITYLSSITLWLLIFVQMWPGSFQTFFPKYGHKIIAVGLMAFYPMIRALWAFRETPLIHRWLLAIDDSLPIAFVATCFGEMYASIAGLGFRITVAIAMEQYDRALGTFMLTLCLLTLLSAIVRFVASNKPLKTGPV